jgi:hypothetical protein
VGHIHKNNQRIEHLGLSLDESKRLLSAVHQQLLKQQFTTFLNAHSTCPDCGAPLDLKARGSRSFRTLLGQIQVGRRRARLLTARFSTPPVAAAPETFTSCSYRMEFLFRLRFMTGELVEDLKVRHDISLSWLLEPMARFDMIHLVFIPRNKPSTPPTPAAVSGIHCLP